MLLKDYTINENTILLTGIYGHYGHLQTMVIDLEKTYRVNGSSEQIIDTTLKKMGSSLRGALDGAKANLGNLKMYPIKINSRSGLYLFPSKSPKKPDCVWFSLFHVKRANTFGKNKTKVFLSQGHTIIIDCTLTSFKNKLHRAQELRRRISLNENSPVTFFLEPTTEHDRNNNKGKDTSMMNDDQKDL